MKTKAIVFTDGDLAAKVTVKQATLLDGMRRSELTNQAFEQPEENNLRQLARVVVYPVLVAGTLTVDLVQNGETLSWPDLDTLLNLPEELTTDWLSAIYALNPRWAPPGQISESDEEKKVN